MWKKNLDDDDDDDDDDDEHDEHDHDEYGTAKELFILLPKTSIKYTSLKLESKVLLNPGKNH